VVIIAPNYFSLLLICLASYCFLQSPFARIRQVTPRFRQPPPVHPISSAFENSKLVQECADFQVVSQLRGGS